MDLEVQEFKENKKMYWFSGIRKDPNNLENYYEYIKMYGVAVLSAKKTNSHIKPVLIFDGEEYDSYTNKLESLGVKIVNHKSSIMDHLNKRWSGAALSTARGAFLRIDIPLICKELDINDDYVLYTDNDVIFNQDISELNNMKCDYIMMSGEFEKFIHNNYINSGVALINLKSMLSIHSDFSKFIIDNINHLDVYDQDAYRLFFNNKIKELSYKFNYKTYWGETINENMKIIHFHGPKPFHKDKIQNDDYPQILKGLITPYYFKTTDEFFKLLNEFESL